MSLLFSLLRAKTSAASKLTSDLMQWTAILCVIFILFSGCRRKLSEQ
jgi:hypothetical protein